ncbi:hypothetical protein PanWU01x14_355720 [Parasponia andersonii]|uniref:Transmembrane protein n=1 Tax=Parasponia andersonii TaxID=3476 RepID=A0A2P5A979_PARAD|nr:hypothetical protein PanWU01x14_355720 [Parasponia andersonii]
MVSRLSLIFSIRECLLNRDFQNSGLTSKVFGFRLLFFLMFLLLRIISVPHENFVHLILFIYIFFF